MSALKFITSHVIYNPAYTYKFQLKTTQEHNWSGWQFTRDVSDVFGFISNENEDKCPSGKKN
jgi:hypothetical protein